MPMQWTPNKPIARHNGITVYHTYINDDGNAPHPYRYTFSSDARGAIDPYAFDIRHLPPIDGLCIDDPANRRLVILRHLIDGTLTHPDASKAADLVTIHNLRSKARALCYFQESFSVSVLDHSNVTVTDQGAWVDARVWLSRTDLAREGIALPTVSD